MQESKILRALLSLLTRWQNQHEAFRVTTPCLQAQSQRSVPALWQSNKPREYNICIFKRPGNSYPPVSTLSMTRLSDHHTTGKRWQPSNRLEILESSLPQGPVLRYLTPGWPIRVTVKNTFHNPSQALLFHRVTAMLFQWRDDYFKPDKAAEKNPKIIWACRVFAYLNQPQS